MNQYDQFADEGLYEDFGLSPTVGASPVVQAPAAPPPQPASVLSNDAALAPRGIASLVPAPVIPAMPQPFGLSPEAVAMDSFDPLTGIFGGTQPVPTLVQPPAAPATQAPAASTTPGFGTDYYNGQRGTWVTQAASGGEGGGQTEQVFVPDRFQGDFTTQYSTAGGYKPFEGVIDPKVFGWAFQKGSNWQFDTMGARKEANEAAAAGPVMGNPETGEAYYANPTTVADPYAVTNEKGESSLDPRYGIKDVSGLVHGRTSYSPDKDHTTYVSAFFDPKTGKQVGQPVTETVKTPKADWIENLATAALFAAPSLFIPGFAPGAALMFGAKSASEGNVLGALAGLTGGIGAIPGVDIPGMDTLKTVGNAAKTVSALTSGDPLQILGAAANLSGSEDLATVSKVANTAALANAALSGDPNAILKLATTYGPDVVDLIKGAPDTGDEVDRLLARYPAPIPDTGDELARLEARYPKPEPTAYVSPEDADIIYGGATTSATPAPLPPDLVDQLIAAGVDTGTEGTSTGIDTGAAPPQPPAPAPIPQDIADQLIAAGLDAGTPGTSTGIGAEAPSTRLSNEELNKFLEDISTGGQFTSTGSSDVDQLLNELAGNKPSSLTEQAKFLESNVEDRGTIDQLLRDYAIDTGQLQGEYAGVGNLPEDFYVTDKGTVKSTYSGEEGTFDEQGNFVPVTAGAAGAAGAAGGTKPVTKTPTTTGVTTAKSSVDPALLAALSMMMTQQPQTEKERVNAAKIAAKSPFGTLPYSDILDAYDQIYGA